VTLPALWTDKPDWITHLRALAATGHINQADADQLAHFADHGWLLMEGAIEPEFVDTLVDDIRKVHSHPGYFATTDFRNGRSHKLNGNQPDARESIFDLYVNLQSSRHVCMHPWIVRFLSLVFQAKVLAFQQLLFQVTNGHRWHQDAAFVVVDTPTLLSATWIVLQDIQKGSGELAYCDRSHRLPHYIFSNNRKHNDGDTTDYPRDIETACKARQLARRRLLAKKGDVFFWTADLAHRSHPLVHCRGTRHGCPA
jgi:phytanoyl-CoA hydroxylase